MIKIIKFLLCRFYHNKNKRDTLWGWRFITMTEMGCAGRIGVLLLFSSLQLTPSPITLWLVIVYCLSLWMPVYSTYHYQISRSLLHCLLASIVSDRKSAVILIFPPPTVNVMYLSLCLLLRFSLCDIPSWSCETVSVVWRETTGAHQHLPTSLCYPVVYLHPWRVFLIVQENNMDLRTLFFKALRSCKHLSHQIAEGHLRKRSNGGRGSYFVVRFFFP